MIKLTPNFDSANIFSLRRTWKPSSSSLWLYISFFLPPISTMFKVFCLWKNNIWFSRHLTYKACLKSNIRYVKLFFPIYWRFELTWVCCVVGYNCHTISSTAIINFVFTRDYFDNFGGPFLASSVINKSKDLLPHLSMKKHVKSLEACLVKRKCKTGNKRQQYPKSLQQSHYFAITSFIMLT